MGFFKRIKESYETIKLAKEVLDYLNQFTYLPDVSNCDVVGSWVLFRNRDGETSWYVTEGNKPLYVEERTQGPVEGIYAFVCSYYTDKKGESDERYAIARGTNDELDVWFNVGDYFDASFVAIGDNGTALFYDEGSEKLHVITPEGAHKTVAFAECGDYAGNASGFFLWDWDDKSVQIKGWVFGNDKAVNKKIKAPGKDYYFEDAELQDDGMHVKFYHNEDDSIREFALSSQGEVTEIRA